MLRCLHCQSTLFGKYSLKFCNRSCSASFNNKQKIKHGKYQERSCNICNKLYSPLTPNSKFCSKRCYGDSIKKYKSDEERIKVVRQQQRASNANYRAKLLSQTPVDIDREAILEFYKNCPPGYEVDHIIPISNGGLHTLSNLQYLTISENRKKGNKII